ncbi:UNVERIFIED_CONTAM: Cadherin-20 [Gekko kuhli]
MDREAKEYYEVIIQAKDMGGQLGGLAGTTTVNVTLSDVNDNPPRFPQRAASKASVPGNTIHMSLLFFYLLLLLSPPPDLPVMPVHKYSDKRGITVNVTCKEHYQMSVLESAPVSATVGRVFAKDLDEGINAEMKYSLVDGDGLDAFDIMTDPNYQVGIITVRKGLLKTLLKQP